MDAADIVRQEAPRKRIRTAEQKAKIKAQAAARYRAKRAAGWKPKPRTKKQVQMVKEIGARWYLKNKSRVRENERRRNLEKPRKRKPYTPAQKERRRLASADRFKNRSEEDKRRASESSKEWRKRNPGRHRQNFKQWTNKNRAKRNKDHREWMAAHPDVRRLHQAKRRAVENGADVGESKLINRWEKKWRRSSRVRCYWCQEFFPGKIMHLDHIIALVSDGKHSLENVCVACQPCNNRKRSKPIEKWNQQIAAPVLF